MENVDESLYPTKIYNVETSEDYQKVAAYLLKVIKDPKTDASLDLPLLKPMFEEAFPNTDHTDQETAMLHENILRNGLLKN